MEINWLAVIVAALSSFPLGYVWYGPLFGKAWMGEVGMTEAKARAANPAVTYGGALALALVQASTFAMFLGPTRNPEAALYGLCAGLAWVGAAIGVQYLFEQRSLKLFLINAGYNTVSFTLIGAIIGGWK